MDAPTLQPTLTSAPAARTWLLACGLFVVGAIAFAFDLPVSQYCLGVGPVDHGPNQAVAGPPTRKLPGDVRKALAQSEVFAHGFGVAVICLAVLFVDPAGRRFVPRLLACAFAAGGAANLLKLFTLPRIRPHAFFSGNAEFMGPISETFVHGYGPGILHPEHSSALQSFPSGHAATAAGLALALTWRYPHARWFFVALATLAAAQRVAFGAHYLSDVLCGAAVGTLTGGLILYAPLPRWVFGRIERPSGDVGSADENRNLRAEIEHAEIEPPQKSAA